MLWLKFKSGLLKKLLFKLLLFIGILAVLSGLFLILNYYLVLNYYPQIDSNKETIVVGDSQALDGLDFSQLGNVMNFSHFADTWFVSYKKIKFLTDKYPNVSTVVTSISPNRFSYSNDHILSNHSSAVEFFNRLYPIINLFEITEFDKNYWGVFEVYTRQMCFLNIDYIRNSIAREFGILSEHYPYYTEKSFGHKILRTNRPLDFKRVINESFTNHPVCFSSIDCQYADSLYTLSKKRGFKLVIIEFPLPESYHQHIPGFVQEYYDNKITQIGAWENAEFYSYPHLLEEDYFVDEIHLNYKGAQFLTRYLKKHLPNLFN